MRKVVIHYCLRTGARVLRPPHHVTCPRWTLGGHRTETSQWLQTDELLKPVSVGHKPIRDGSKDNQIYLKLMYFPKMTRRETVSPPRSNTPAGSHSSSWTGLELRLRTGKGAFHVSEIQLAATQIEDLTWASMMDVFCSLSPDGAQLSAPQNLFTPEQTDVSLINLIKSQEFTSD